MSIKELRELLERHKGRPESFAHELRLSVGEIIIGRLRELNWTQRELAARIGKSEPLISRLLNGDHNWTSESIGRVMHALDVRIRARRADARPVWLSGEVSNSGENKKLTYISGDGTSTDYRLTTSGAENEQSTARQVGKLKIRSQAVSEA